MRLVVDTIYPKVGATVWEGQGHLPDGSKVTFAGDWRPMHAIGEALVSAGEEPIYVDVEPFLILKVEVAK